MSRPSDCVKMLRREFNCVQSYVGSTNKPAERLRLKMRQG